MARKAASAGLAAFGVRSPGSARPGWMEGHVEGGLMPAGQCAAAGHDMRTVAEVIEEVTTQARALLRNAVGWTEQAGSTSGRPFAETTGAGVG